MSKHKFTDIRVPIDTENPSIIRDEEKCIKCGQCKRVCTSPIGVAGRYDLEETDDRPICIHCGQCANVCPPSSITEKKEYELVIDAIADPNKIVVFNTSPSVRIALGEEFGMPDGSFVQGKMVALLRALGGDYVLDTNFAADMTIMEEASELIERLTKQTKPLPQFTSCCPAWVKYVETFYPDMRQHLSTAKSPIGMQGVNVKTYFAEKMGISAGSIVNVAVTPCTAKKFEIRRPEMNASGRYIENEEIRDMDLCITTRELAGWAEAAGVDFERLEDSDYDKFMGEASGAGVIFGNTGGVMEAAVRTAYYLLHKKNPPVGLYQFQDVRGLTSVKEAELEMAEGIRVRLAVVYGTEQAGKLIEQIQKGEKIYDFIEVMTCPGGCIGGGGQPKDTQWKGDALLKARIDGLYARESSMEHRASHENEQLNHLYTEFYGKPLSEKTENLLHTVYFDRGIIN